MSCQFHIPNTQAETVNGKKLADSVLILGSGSCKETEQEEGSDWDSKKALHTETSFVCVCVWTHTQT